MFKIYTLIILSLLVSCSSTEKTKSKSDKQLSKSVSNNVLKSKAEDIFKLTLTKYCVNYNNLKNYSYSIKESTLSKYFFNDIVFKYKPVTAKRKLFTREVSVNGYSPVKIKGSKVKVVQYGKKTLYFDINLFFKKLWIITIKKEIKRTYSFLGDEEIYYKVQHLFVDDKANKVFYSKSSDYKLEHPGDLNIRIENYLKLNKNIQADGDLNPPKIEKLILEIIKALKIYPKRKDILIYNPSKEKHGIKGYWHIFISKQVEIVINPVNKTVHKIIYTPSKFFSFFGIAKPYENLYLNSPDSDCIV